MHLNIIIHLFFEDKIKNDHLIYLILEEKYAKEMQSNVLFYSLFV